MLSLLFPLKVSVGGRPWRWPHVSKVFWGVPFEQHQSQPNWNAIQCGDRSVGICHESLKFTWDENFATPDIQSMVQTVVLIAELSPAEQGQPGKVGLDKILDPDTCGIRTLN